MNGAKMAGLFVAPWRRAGVALPRARGSAPAQVKRDRTVVTHSRAAPPPECPTRPLELALALLQTAGEGAAQY